MADIQANGLRRGTAIIHDGVPYRVLQFEHRTPGNKRGFVQTKLRNLRDGSQREVKFSATEMIQRAHVEDREMEYLYSEPDGAVFMDTQDYEQTSLNSEALGNAKPWLQEGMHLQIEMLDGQPIAVRLPKAVDVTVREAEAVVKGQTASKSNKPAVLENGVTIQVPPFIEAGDRVRVDPAEQRYIERCK
ncbi:MAG: elongation factor P [bacterium]|nr:elongation factor P [bacterium]